MNVLERTSRVGGWKSWSESSSRWLHDDIFVAVVVLVACMISRRLYFPKSGVACWICLWREIFSEVFKCLGWSSLIFDDIVSRNCLSAVGSLWFSCEQKGLSLSGRSQFVSMEAAPGGDAELVCKTLQVEHKLFYFDLKENPRGRYLKISEKTSGSRSTIIVPVAGIVWFVDLFTYYASSEEELSSKELQLDTKVSCLKSSRQVCSLNFL